MCDPVFYMRVKLTWNIKFLTNSQPLLCDCCLLVCQVPLTSHLLLVVPCGQRRLLELLDLPDARTVCYGPGSCQLATVQGDFSPDSPLWGEGGGTGWLNGIHGRAAAAQYCPQMQAKLAVTAQKSVSLFLKVVWAAVPWAKERREVSGVIWRCHHGFRTVKKGARGLAWGGRRHGRNIVTGSFLSNFGNTVDVWIR